MLGRLTTAAVLLVLVAAPALAQAPPPGLAWARGTVAKLDGDKLMVKAGDGTETTLALTDKTRVQTLVKKSVADIKPGDVLASVGVKGTDGKLHAVEVRILPQPFADGGRQFAWDLGPGSMMTNAAVGTVAKAPEGALLHVKFKGGETDYSVGPDTAVLAPAPGDKSLLKPGAAVFAFCRKAADGGLTVAAIYVEKNGIKPPM